MIRRLRMACVGLGVFILPACVGSKPLSDPYYTGGGPGYVLMNRPGVPPGMYQRQAPDKSTNGMNANATVADQKFGPILPADPPKANARMQGTILPPEIIEQPAKVVVSPDEKPARFEQPVAVESPLSDRSQWPKIAVDPVHSPKESAAPRDLIAPKWPQLGPTTVEHTTPVKTPNALPELDLPPPTQHAPPVIAPPLVAPPVEPMQPMTMGTSMKLTDPLTPVVGSAPSSDESTLVRAMKAFQNNRPDEAVDHLKRLDATNQEVLLYLMPLMVRLGEGNLNAMAPDELAMLIDRLQTATGMLKSKASLRIDRAIFCRGVRKFADVDPYDPRHEFRPGDMVFLYAELKNFTCESRGQAVGASPVGKPAMQVAIRLGASLELRDARNGVVWRTDLTKNDFAQTPPQDYYHTYRFCVPEKLPPGTYTLWLTVIDKPTNRAIRKPLELRVGQG